MAEVQCQLGLAKVEVDLEAVAVEDPVVRLDVELLQRCVVAAEIREARLVMRLHVHRAFIEQALSGGKGDIDAARVVAVDELEMAVADVGEPVDVVGKEGVQDA